MKLCRRRLLQLAAGAVALPITSRFARAQAYPMRPVRWIVPYGAGASDVLARLMARWLSEHLGQQFVIENRPGGGTNIGTEAVVRAAADGYTLLLMAPSGTINATLYDNLSFSLVRDIAPVASITRQPQVMLVHPSFPAKTVPEFIAYAKAHPGKINLASVGVGSGQHLAGELFNMMTGIKMVHIPYRGGAPAITDLIGGQVHVMFTSPFGVIESIRAGKLRAIGVTTATRSDALPEVPCVGDFVPGFEVTSWFGVGAPKNTPIEIVDKLNRHFKAAVSDPEIKSRLSDTGAAPFVNSPTEFGKFIADEIEKWAKVIKFAGLKPV